MSESFRYNLETWTFHPYLHRSIVTCSDEHAVIGDDELRNRRLMNMVLSFIFKIETIPYNITL